MLGLLAASNGRPALGLVGVLVLVLGLSQCGRCVHLLPDVAWHNSFYCAAHVSPYVESIGSDCMDGPGLVWCMWHLQCCSIQLDSWNLMRVIQCV
jgi:hypothetical protein